MLGDSGDDHSGIAVLRLADRNQLEGDFTPESCVACPIHFTHAPGAQTREDFVDAYPCAISNDER